MDEKELQFLREITDLKGTSGGEGAVRDYFREKYTGLADKVPHGHAGHRRTADPGRRPYG